MTTKVLILGGGIHGLLANYILSGTPGIETNVVTRSRAPNDYYTHAPERGVSSELRNVLDELDIAHSTDHLQTVVFDGARTKSVVYDKSTTFNTQFDGQELFSTLLEFASPTFATIELIDLEHGAAKLKNGTFLEFDALVVAAPSTETARIEGMRRFGIYKDSIEERILSTIVCLEPERFMEGDVIEIRGAKFIERIWHTRGEKNSFMVEAKTKFSREEFADELAYVFADKFDIESYDMRSVQILSRAKTDSGVRILNPGANYLAVGPMALGIPSSIAETTAIVSAWAEGL